MRWFSESEFTEIYAIAGNYRCPQAKEEFPDFYDNVVMTGTFENGMQGCIDGAVSVRYGYDARTEIVGTNGVLFVGRLHENEVVVCNKDRGIVARSWKPGARCSSMPTAGKTKNLSKTLLKIQLLE